MPTETAIAIVQLRVVVACQLDVGEDYIGGRGSREAEEKSYGLHFTEKVLKSVN